ncbi:MAG: YeeE/YedE thiosulfate transporter family protein [Parvibaculum sp.]
MTRLTDPSWSPYLAGGLIGLLQIPAFLLMDTGLGASSSFVTAAGQVAVLVDPMVQEGSYFSKYLASDKYVWQVALVVGVVFGAFFSARASGMGRRGVAPVWRSAFNIRSDAARYAMAFLGGFVLLFGARLAGGCTSGHGLTGMAQLAVSSSVVVAAIFAGGIASAFLLTRRA